MIEYIIMLCFFTCLYIVSRCSALPSPGVILIVAHLHGGGSFGSYLSAQAKVDLIILDDR